MRRPRLLILVQVPETTLASNKILSQCSSLATATTSSFITIHCVCPLDISQWPVERKVSGEQNARGGAKMEFLRTLVSQHKLCDHLPIHHTQSIAFLENSFDHDGGL